MLKVQYLYFFHTINAIFGLWSIALPVLQAQNKPFNTVWSSIEIKMDATNVDTSFQFILSEVKAHCKGDLKCLLLTYDTIQTRLERKFQIDAAIKVTEEIIRLAEQNNLVEKIAKSHSDFFRYFEALNNARASSFHLELALKHYMALGDKSNVILCNFRKIYKTSYENKEAETLLKLNDLVLQALHENDSLLAGYLISYIFPLSIEIEKQEKVETRFITFETLMKSFTKLPKEKRCWAIFWEQKGRFCLKNGNLQNAKINFEKALDLLKFIEDRWLEVNTILNLVDVDWELGNHPAAKSRLEQVFAMSEKIKSDDLLVRIYSTASRIAEEEGRFADALLYQKKMNATQERIATMGDTKITQNYYLEVENKTRALELKQSNDRLIFTLVVSILALLLAAAFLYGFYKQRKIRRELAIQNALIQAQAEELKSLDEVKSRFFANISHELRTPLTLLTSPIKTLLKENQFTEKQIKLLQVADRNGKQLGQLINDILDLRKLEMGKMQLYAEPTDLRSYFQAYFSQFEWLAVQKNLLYTYVIDIPAGSIADLDREKCRQILYNLLANAFKFTPQSCKIEARVAVTVDQMQIKLADSGAGIHPDDLPFVFDHYFQSRRPDKPVDGGTGIGLALCREYVQLFGGSIQVESDLGKGSTFTVCFPITLLDDVPENMPPLDDMGSDTFLESETNDLVFTPLNGFKPNVERIMDNSTSNHPIILLVEDNTDLQSYIKFILSDKYNVITACNGQIALELLKSNPNSVPICPALILTDLMMPVMDGYQLLEQLKSDDATRHIPTIMLTARAEASDKLRALRIGVDDYLTKPFEEDELLVRIENLLKNQSIRLQEITASAEKGAHQPIMSQPDRVWLEGFEAYVQKHFASDILSVSSLAFEFAMSESTLLRQLKRLTGLSPVQYIQEVRLNEARRLLENRTYDSIAQVAFKVGYDDARHFSRSFKHRFGKLPSEIIEH